MFCPEHFNRVDRSLFGESPWVVHICLYLNNVEVALLSYFVTFQEVQNLHFIM